MDLLDDLFEIGEAAEKAHAEKQEREAAAAAAASAACLTAEKTEKKSKKSDANDDEELSEAEEEKDEESTWLTSGRSTGTKTPASSSSGKYSGELVLWDTKIEKLDKEQLVWARIDGYFKGKGATKSFVPAILRDAADAVGIPGIPWPLPDHMVLVEYIKMCKSNPSVKKIELQEKINIRPFHCDVTRKEDDKSKKKQKSMDAFLPSSRSGQVRGASKIPPKVPVKEPTEWDLTSERNCQDLFAQKLSSSRAERLFKAVMKCARELLSLALERPGEPGSDSDDEETKETKRKNAEEYLQKMEAERELQQSIVSGLADKGKAKEKKEDPALLEIRPETWITYMHPIFKKEMIDQVVEVRKNFKSYSDALRTTSGGIFDRDTEIVVLATKDDGSYNIDRKSKQRRLCEFTLVPGRSKRLRDADEMAHDEAQRDGDRIRGNGAGGVVYVEDEVNHKNDGSSEGSDGGGGAHEAAAQPKPKRRREEKAEAEAEAKAEAKAEAETEAEVVVVMDEAETPGLTPDPEDHVMRGSGAGAGSRDESIEGSLAAQSCPSTVYGGSSQNSDSAPASAPASATFIVGEREDLEEDEEEEEDDVIVI